MQLGKGDVFQVPVATGQGVGAVRVHSLVIDDVRQTDDGRIYFFHDDRGPALYVREARLRWLQHRFEQALQRA